MSAAIEFVDANGLDAMTMRSLGQSMGVDPTAVYRHFPTKEDLVNAMVDRFLCEIEDTLDTGGADARERIVNRATATRTTFRRHPDIGVAMIYSTGQSMAGFRLSTGVARDIIDLGVAPGSVAVWYQMLEGFVLGSCCQDFIGSPRNFAIRRERYRAFDMPQFDAVAKDESSVAAVSDAAFAAGLEALLDRMTP